MSVHRNKVPVCVSTTCADPTSPTYPPYCHYPHSHPPFSGFRCRTPTFPRKKGLVELWLPLLFLQRGCKHFSERGGASAAAAVSPAPLAPPTLVLSTKCKSSGLRRTSGSYRHVDTVVAEIRLFLSVQWRARFNRERMKGHVQNVGTKCSRVHVWQCDRAQHCGPRFLE